MSFLASRSPPQSPAVRQPQARLRTDTMDSASSSGTVYASRRRSTDGAADGAVPTSPSSNSTASVGSPRTFYSFAQQQGSILDAATPDLNGNGFYAAVSDRDEGGEDIGDRTIGLQDDTPRKLMPSAIPMVLPKRDKGKRREETWRAYNDTGAPADGANEEADGGDEEDESARVEQNLRRWAEKEKLKRAKTRSRQGSVSSVASQSGFMTEGIGGLARRLSNGARRSKSLRDNPGQASRSKHRDGSRKLKSIDSNVSAVGISSASTSSPTDELELQRVNPKRMSPKRSHTSPDAPPSSNLSPVYGSPPPVSTSRVDFPDRVERAAKTGSRFIEDLEDQQVANPFNAGPPNTGYQRQSYHANAHSPLASPTKSVYGGTGGPQTSSTPLGKLGRLKLGAGSRTNSVASFASLNSIVTGSGGGSTGNPFSPSPLSPVGPHNAVTARSSVASLRSPTDSIPVPPQDKAYFHYPGESSSHLGISPRQSRDFYQSSAYREQPDGSDFPQRRTTRGSSAAGDRYSDDGDSSTRQVGWLQWFFCCGCLGAGIRLDDDDVQAGRTGPE